MCLNLTEVCKNSTMDKDKHQTHTILDVAEGNLSVMSFCPACEVSGRRERISLSISLPPLISLSPSLPISPPLSLSLLPFLLLSPFSLYPYLSPLCPLSISPLPSLPPSLSLSPFLPSLSPSLTVHCVSQVVKQEELLCECSYNNLIYHVCLCVMYLFACACLTVIVVKMRVTLQVIHCCRSFC